MFHFAKVKHRTKSSAWCGCRQPRAPAGAVVCLFCGPAGAVALFRPSAGGIDFLCPSLSMPLSFSRSGEHCCRHPICRRPSCHPPLLSSALLSSLSVVVVPVVVVVIIVVLSFSVAVVVRRRIRPRRCPCRPHCRPRRHCRRCYVFVVCSCRRLCTFPGRIRLGP